MLLARPVAGRWNWLLRVCCGFVAGWVADSLCGVWRRWECGRGGCGCGGRYLWSAEERGKSRLEMMLSSEYFLGGGCVPTGACHAGWGGSTAFERVGRAESRRRLTRRSCEVGLAWPVEGRCWAPKWCWRLRGGLMRTSRERIQWLQAGARKRCG